MDALKNFASGNSQNTGNTNAQQTGEKKDFGDKSKLSHLRASCLFKLDRRLTLYFPSRRIHEQEAGR